MLRKSLLTTVALLGLMASGSGAGPQGSQEVRLTVTPKGFVPAVVTVRAGQPVTLLVTRRTNRTCATEFVLKPYKIDEKLPLDKTVAIRFTPKARGELDYACGMGMIHGKILVK